MKIKNLFKSDVKGFTHHVLIFALIIVAIAAVGAKLAYSGHADPITPLAVSSSQASGVIHGPDGSTIDPYNTISSNKLTVYALAVFNPHGSNVRLRSLTIKLKGCNDTLLEHCSFQSQNSKIKYYPGGREYYSQTPGKGVEGGAFYSACVTFTTNTSWKATNDCQTYTTYGASKWVGVHRTSKDYSFTPTFRACMLSETGAHIVLRLEAIRPSATVKTQTLTWAPNLSKDKPAGNIVNGKWLFSDYSVTEASIPKVDQMAISYKAGNSQYSYTTLASPPKNLKKCY